MQHTRYVVSSFLISIGFLAVSALGVRTVATDSDLHSRAFEFTYRVHLDPTSLGEGSVRLWIPYPHSDAHQEISDLTIEGTVPGAVYEEPGHGNLDYFVSVPSPNGPVDVTMRFRAVRRENVHRDFTRADAGRSLPEEVQRYLRPDALVPMNPEIRTQAERITAGQSTPAAKARAIYDYAIAHLKYDKTGQGWGHGDLLYVCDEKRGNCTDFHAFFIGFARAVGIPARFSIGFPIPPDESKGTISGYHCWAEFYLSGYGWVPVDASEAWKHPEKKDYFFGGHDENRIQFTTGRDLVLRPAQQGGPLNYFIYPYAEIDGRPVQGLEYEFSFRDLDGTSGEKRAPSAK